TTCRAPAIHEHSIYSTPPNRSPGLAAARPGPSGAGGQLLRRTTDASELLPGLLGELVVRLESGARQSGSGDDSPFDRRCLGLGHSPRRRSANADAAAGRFAVPSNRYRPGAPVSLGRSGGRDSAALSRRLFAAAVGWRPSAGLLRAVDHSG